MTRHHEKVGYPCEHVGTEYFTDAPYRFPAHVIVPVEPSRVFDVFTDGPSWSRWALPIQDVEWTSPFPLEVGSTRTVTMTGGLIGYEEFIVWEPPHRMAFRFNEVSRPGVAAFAEHYNVTDLGDGRSLVEWAMAMTPDGPGAKAFPLTAPMLGAGVRYMLGRFKRYVASNPVLADSPHAATGRSGRRP